MDGRYHTGYVCEVRRLLGTLVLVALLAPAAASAEAPLPPRARSISQDRYASPKGFRDTAEWYRKELDRRGETVEFTPVERIRDTTFLRILSKNQRSGWLAIHIVLAEGKTTIYIVAPRTRGSSNGRTYDSDSYYLGSNPSPRTDAAPPHHAL